MNLTSNALFVYDSLQPFLENGSNHRTARPSTTLFWSLLMERFIRPMAPGWFASVMGTAVTSLVLTLASTRPRTRVPRSPTPWLWRPPPCTGLQLL